MAIFADGSFRGSVSGGCVESDVANRAAVVRADGSPRVVEYHEVTDPVFEVGLNCDGSVMVLLETVSQEQIALLTSRRRGYLETRVDGIAAGLRGAPVGVARRFVEGNPAAHDRAAAPTADGAQKRAAAPAAAPTADGAQPSVPVETRATSRREADSVILRQPVGLRSKLFIFGATEIATVLASLAARVGFDVTVSDPRGAFADPEHHPEAHRVIAAWPQEVFEAVAVDDSSFVVSLNHEPRFEDALLVALMEQERPAYIGAIGKPARAREREARQASAGFDLAKLPPVHTPIGVPIGGKSPEEIAVSILAQLIAVRNGK